MITIDTFNNYKPARISKELYEIDKCRWRLSVPASRLLFALSQTVSEDRQTELFQEIDFRLDVMFEYLGMSNNNDRYNRLDLAFKEIMSNNLHIVTTDKKGNKQWFGVSWIKFYKFSMEDPFVKIAINEYVRPFLRNLQQYARIQPKIYLRLSSEYQNWFYPYFKQYENLGKWMVSIEDLKQSLILDEEESYNPQKNYNANDNFFKKVLGIELSEVAKKENTLSKKEKRQAKPIAWNYVNNKNGDYTGTLFHITEKTDINVTASCLKTGRSYTHIVFFISSKKKVNGNYKGGDTNAGADMDFQRPKRRKAKTQSDMKDIFASEFDERLFIPNPAYEKELPRRVAFYTDGQIIDMAKETNKTVEQVVKLMRLQKDSQGRWFKEY